MTVKYEGVEVAAETRPPRLKPSPPSPRRIPELVGTLPAVIVYAALAVGWIARNPSFVGEYYDDAGYFLMSRNLWRYGAPLLDHTGTATWSTTWSPGLPLLLSPFAWLPQGQAVAAERVAVAAMGVALLVVTHSWLRKEVGLDRVWAASALLCLGATPLLYAYGAHVMSDVPAALAIMAGIVLLRRNHLAWGMAAVVAAYALRTIDVVAIPAAIVWLLWSGQLRRAGPSIVTGVLGGAGWTALQLLHRGSTSYVATLFQRSLADPTQGVASPGDWALRILSNLGAIASGEAAEMLTSLNQSHFLANASILTAASLLVVGLTAAGIWRQRLHLELLVGLATLAVVIIWPWDPQRFLLPLAPLAAGGIAAALAGRGGPVTALALGLAALSLGTNLKESAAIIPNRENVSAEHSQVRVYKWVHDHAHPGQRVAAFDEVTCFVYSGHPTDHDLRTVGPGALIIVSGGTDGPSMQAAYNREVQRRFPGRVVHQDGPFTVLEIS